MCSNWTITKALACCAVLTLAMPQSAPAQAPAHVQMWAGYWMPETANPDRFNLYVQGEAGEWVGLVLRVYWDWSKLDDSATVQAKYTALFQLPQLANLHAEPLPPYWYLGTAGVIPTSGETVMSRLLTTYGPAFGAALLDSTGDAWQQVKIEPAVMAAAIHDAIGGGVQGTVKATMLPLFTSSNPLLSAPRLWPSAPATWPYYQNVLFGYPDPDLAVTAYSSNGIILEQLLQQIGFDGIKTLVEGGIGADGQPIEGLDKSDFKNGFPLVLYAQAIAIRDVADQPVASAEQSMTGLSSIIPGVNGPQINNPPPPAPPAPPPRIRVTGSIIIRTYIRSLEVGIDSVPHSVSSPVGRAGNFLEIPVKGTPIGPYTVVLRQGIRTWTIPGTLAAHMTFRFPMPALITQGSSFDIVSLTNDVNTVYGAGMPWGTLVAQ